MEKELNYLSGKIEELKERINVVEGYDLRQGGYGQALKELRKEKVLLENIFNELNKNLTYKGKLEIDEFGCLTCDGWYLVEAIQQDFKKGDKVFVKYFISDKEISLEEAEKALVLRTCGGNIDELEFVLEAYSEFTINEYEEELKIGGHDLFEHLQEQNGKYLILQITKQ